MKIEGKFHVGEIAHFYCVYRHVCEPHGTIFIGSCRMDKIFDMSEPRRNDSWAKTTTAISISLEFIKTHIPDAAEAEALRDAHIEQEKPLCIVHGKTADEGMTIRCDTDGREFATMTEAAATYRVARSSISNHLAKRYGYATVAGLTFSRI